MDTQATGSSCPSSPGVFLHDTCPDLGAGARVPSETEERTRLAAPPSGWQGSALGPHVRFKRRLLGDLHISSTVAGFVCKLTATVAYSTLGCQSRERWPITKAGNTHFTWSSMNGPSYETKYDSLSQRLWVFFIFNIIGVFLTFRYVNFSSNLTSL